jgi:DNA-binding response OmpR family regulator
MAYKVLIVDDEPSICRALRQFLENRGFQVLVAHDGFQALEAYSWGRPDVVLLDVLMPKMSGLVVLRELRALDPGANVIMVTAVHEENLARQALSEGAFDYITKPIDPAYLELALMTKIALLCR